MEGGTLQQNANLILSALGGTGGTVNTNGKQLTLGKDTTETEEATFAGTLSGNGTLIKTGEGRQELSGAVTLASMEVQDGTLALSGTTTTTGGISVADGGTLALNGNTTTGDISVAYGGNLELNNATMQSGISLALGSTATLAGDLTLAQTITSEGAVTLNEGVHFNLNSGLGSYDAATQTYTIISGGNITYADSGFTFTVDGISSSDMEADNYELGLSYDFLTIKIGELMRDISWNASGTQAAWSTADNQTCWLLGGNATSFNSLDNVTFGSTGSRAVDVAPNGVKVSSMEVTGEDYLFSGGDIRSLGDVSIASGASATFGAGQTIYVAGEGALSSQGTVTLEGNLDGRLNVESGGKAVLGANAGISGAATVAEGGELVLNGFDISLAKGVSGAGTLSVDAGDTVSGRLTNIAEMGLPTLQLLSGRYEGGATAAIAPTVKVQGGQYYITGGTHSNTFVLGGSGWGGNDANKAAALRVEGGANLGGSISLSSDATMAVTGSGATISGPLSTGDYTLTKAGSAMLTLTADSVSGNIDVQSGVLRIWGKVVTGELQSLTIRNGATLNVGEKNSGAQLKAGAIHMEEGSTILLYNGNKAGGIFDTNVMVSGTAKLSGGINGNYLRIQGTIKGHGTLNLTSHGSNKWVLESTISDGEDGALSVVSNATEVHLTGNSNYTGGTRITGGLVSTWHLNALGGGALTMEGGTLRQDANLNLSSLSGTGGTVNTNGKELTLGNGTSATNSATFSGTLSGEGNLTMSGEGRQEFTGNISLNSISVTKGTLSLSDTTGASFGWGLEASENGTLSLHNVTMSSPKISAQSGGRVELSGDISFTNLNSQIHIGNGGTLLLSDVKVTGSVTVQGATSSALLTGDVELSQTILSGGSVTLGENLNFILNTETFGGYDSSTSTYTLISGNGDIIDSGFSVTVDGTRYEADNYSKNTELGLSITLLELGRDLTWTGQQGGVWQTGGSANDWQNNSTEGDSFRSQDNVSFGSNGSSAVHVAAQGVTVGSMEVAEADYVFSGGAIESRGDMSIATGASASFESGVTVEGKLTVEAGASASFASGAELGALALTTDSGNTTLKFAGDTSIDMGDVARRKLGNSAQEATAQNGVTINVGTNSTVEDEGYWSMYGGTLTIEGTGVYTVDGICLSDGGKNYGNQGGWRGPQSYLNIREGATMMITGTTASSDAPGDGNKASFNLGHWRSKDSNNNWSILKNQVNIEGTLISNADFSLRDGSADINVSDTGSLAMVNGLSLVTYGSSGTVSLNVEGTLALGGTSNASNNKLTVNLASGATLAAWAGENGMGAGEVTVNTNFNVATDATLNFRADAEQKLTVSSNLRNADRLSASGGGSITLANVDDSLSSVTLGSGTKLSLGNKTSVRLAQATLAQGSSLSVAGESVTLGAKAAPVARSRAVQAEGTLKNVELAGASMTAASEGAQAVVSDAEVDINATSFSISGLELEDSELLLDSTTLDLHDVLLTDSHISGISAAESRIEMMEDVTLALSRATWTLKDGSLYGDAYAGKTVGVFSVNAFNNVTLTGSLLMDVSTVAAMAAETTANSSTVPDFYAIDFGNNNGLVLDNLSLNAKLGPSGTMAEGERAGDSAYMFEAPADAIPEPASAALALLGLSGLAIRRRRK